MRKALWFSFLLGNAFAAKCPNKLSEWWTALVVKTQHYSIAMSEVRWFRLGILCKLIADQIDSAVGCGNYNQTPLDYEAFNRNLLYLVQTVKGAIPQEWSYLPWTIEHRDPRRLWRMSSATPDLRLPSQPKSTATASWPILISHSNEDRGLSWPEWLVKYTLRRYTHERSPVSLLSQLGVE